MQKIQNHTGDFASVVVANGVVYVGTQDDVGGSVYAIDPSSGTYLWTYRTTDVTLNGPAVVNGTLYVGLSGTLDAFRLSNH